VTVSINKEGIESAGKPITVYKALPSLTGTVAVAGTTQVGLSLTANTPSLEGSGAISYQWERGDSATGSFTGISGATSETYTLTTADLNKYIRVTVSRTGYNGTLTSDPTTAAVTPQPPGTRNITIGFNYGDITITGDNRTNIIYKTSASPSSVALSATGYVDVKWYVDGNDSPAGNGASITLEASGYSAKTHSITFTGKKDGKLYSQVIPFTVKN
jgi:hypothetical protein